VSDIPDPNALLRAELAAISALPRHKEGLVPDTYDRLHGIAFLRAARPAPEISDPHTRLYLALYQSQTVALYNIAHLFARCARSLASRDKDRIDVVSHHLRWVFSIAKLTYDLAHSSRSILSDVSPDVLVSQPCQAQLIALQALSDLDAALTSYINHNEADISASIEHNYLLSGPSVLAHMFKSISYLLRTMHSTITKSPREELLRSDTLRDGVHSFDSETDTYLMQFRLVHQIPEILSIEAVPLLEEAARALKRNKIRNAAAHLSLVNLCLVHIRNSLWPLIELMYPSEYYYVRVHLGRTSGSSSVELGHNLLRSAYVKFTNEYVNLAKRNVRAHSAMSALSEQVTLLQENIYQWREMHIMLPRNVLGDDVTSLIGSRNSLQTVLAMKTAFESDDPLRPGQQKPTAEPVADTGARAPSYFLADQSLCKITGAISKRKFPDVESRDGIFAPKAKRSVTLRRLRQAKT
jgi:hypothetical protein